MAASSLLRRGVLREIWQADTRASAEAAMNTFAEKYGAKYEQTVTCLTKDRDALLAFYDFPADHWDHLRAGSPIESVFATVRHRTVRTKGALSQKTAKLIVFKLVQAAGKIWRRLLCPEFPPSGVRPMGADVRQMGKGLSQFTVKLQDTPIGCITD